MATNLDLQEQEQIAELKHFWNRYGNLITWFLIVVMGALAAWNGYNYWQRTQVQRAAVLFDEAERAASADELDRLERVFSDLKSQYGKTTYASQAGLLSAKVFYAKNKTDEAQDALRWVAAQSSDLGYQAQAKLRLSSILLENKSYDEALTLLAGHFPVSYSPLVDDRKGDIYFLQNKKQEAINAYKLAYSGLEERNEYRRLVLVKLNALGVTPDVTSVPGVVSTKEKT